MTHHTKDKGDIAAAIAIADLTRKGFTCLTPVISEHLPFDLIAYKDKQCIRIQCKYSTDGLIKNRMSWADKNGSHVKKYSLDDFDYYAVYLPDIDKVIYPSISFGGKTIRTTLPEGRSSFYWWEDFISFTDKAVKKDYNDFGIPYSELTSERKQDRPESRKVIRPSKEELSSLIWAMPMSSLAKKLGVSDKAVAKWIKRYNLIKPPLGHWTKNPIMTS